MKFQLRHVLIATALVAVLFAIVASEPLGIAAAFFAILLSWFGVARLLAILVVRCRFSVNAARQENTWQPLTQLIRLVHVVAVVGLLLVVIVALINHVDLESVAGAKRAAAWSWIVCPAEWARMVLSKPNEPS